MYVMASGKKATPTKCTKTQVKPNVTFREHLRKNAHASSLASSFDLLTSGRSTIFQSSKSRKKQLKKRSLKVTFGFT